MECGLKGNIYQSDRWELPKPVVHVVIHTVIMLVHFSPHVMQQILFLPTHKAKNQNFCVHRAKSLNSRLGI